jgi:hypothetical protein
MAALYNWKGGKNYQSMLEWRKLQTLPQEDIKLILLIKILSQAQHYFFICSVFLEHNISHPPIGIIYVGECNNLLLLKIFPHSIISTSYIIILGFL